MGALKRTNLFLSEKRSDTEYPYNPGLEEIKYEAKSFFCLLDELFADGKTDLREAMHVNTAQSSGRDSVRKKLAELDWFTPLYCVRYQQHLYKNPSFSAEKEWRLFVSYPIEALQEPCLPIVNYSDRVDKDGKIIEDQKFGYVVKNNTLISHIEQILPNLPNMISEIVIGPKCDISENDMKTYLAVNGMQKTNGKLPKVSKSVSTYR